MSVHRFPSFAAAVLVAGLGVVADLGGQQAAPAPATASAQPQPQEKSAPPGPGGESRPGDDPFLIRRIDIAGSDRPWQFRQKIRHGTSQATRLQPLRYYAARLRARLGRPAA